MANQDSVNSTPVQAEPQARSRTKEITLASGGRPIDTPLPLSFPSILRNPGISDRFAHLRVQPSKTPAPIFSKKLKNRTDENGGKRWVRRKDNARFVGNPHVVAATKKDYSLQPTVARATFPEPLPPYLNRNTNVPATSTPTRDPSSANAGRFSLSLRGMRRELRKSGLRAEFIVRDVEHEILHWLQSGGTVMSPDTQTPIASEAPGRPIGVTETIFEVSRTPLQLVWRIADDAFGRYVVHCCARYHEIVSFSKEVSGERLTFLLRPNVTRPDSFAVASLDTPPVTDIDVSSQHDTESDFTSDTGMLSDVSESDIEQGEAAHPTTADNLSVISEDTPAPARASNMRISQIPDDDWSLAGDTDAEGDESASDAELAASIDSLSMQPEVDPDATLRVPYSRQPFGTPRAWDGRRTRSASSPSRSPSRKQPRRGPVIIQRRRPGTHKGTFYEYLFS